MIRRFTRPYARAIMEVAGSPQQAQSTLTELQRFEEARRSSHDLAVVFDNPAIDFASKVRIAQQIGAKLALSPVALRIVEVLIKNHRINQLAQVNAAVRQMINSQIGVEVARVRSALPLDDAEQAKLRAALESRFGKTIELEVTTDPSLLAGLVAQVGSEVYDTSVAGRIARFQESLA